MLHESQHRHHHQRDKHILLLSLKSTLAQAGEASRALYLQWYYLA